MSQRAEKYASSMEKRVINLEQAVGKVTNEQKRQSFHISELEDDLAVYRAAVAERDLKEARRKLQNQRQQSRMAGKARRKKARTTAVLAALVVVELILLMLIICFISAAERDKQADISPVSTAAYKPEAMPEFLAATTEQEEPGMPAEEETREESAQNRSCFSAEIPLSFEYQDVMRTYCEAYGCPYPLALAVAEVESHFDMDAVGAAGEVGIMQLNPGPGGSYHAEIQAATGLDPTTPSGNIAGGCYKLGQYMAEFQDVAKAVMAYNMGRTGAMEAWAAGITSTDYSDAVLAAMEDWECTVNAWNGQ